MRALGQAFDVCHKLNPRPQVKDQEKKEERKDGEREVKETDIDEEEEVTVGEELQSTVKVTDLDALTEEQERRKEGDLIKFPVTFDEDDAGFNWASQMGSTKPNGNLLETQGVSPLDSMLGTCIDVHTYVATWVRGVTYIHMYVRMYVGDCGIRMYVGDCGIRMNVGDCGIRMYVGDCGIRMYVGDCGIRMYVGDCGIRMYVGDCGIRMYVGDGLYVYACTCV